MECKIVTLWNDKELNNSLSKKAKEICQERFSKIKLNISWDHFLKNVAKKNSLEK